MLSLIIVFTTMKIPFVQKDASQDKFSKEKVRIFSALFTGITLKFSFLSKKTKITYQALSHVNLNSDEYGINHSEKVLTWLYRNDKATFC